MFGNDPSRAGNGSNKRRHVCERKIILVVPDKVKIAFLILTPNGTLNRAHVSTSKLTSALWEIEHLLQVRCLWASGDDSVHKSVKYANERAKLASYLRLSAALLTLRASYVIQNVVAFILQLCPLHQIYGAFHFVDTILSTLIISVIVFSVRYNLWRVPVFYFLFFLVYFF